MYTPLTMKSGVAAVNDYLGGYTVQNGPDGLTLAPPGGAAFASGISVPDRLWKWLLDLRLLRGIPITYLVPDEALLPAESIRFFNIDPTWLDRVIDGVFSTATTGTVDVMFASALLLYARQGLDNEMAALAKAQVPNTNWTFGKGPTTGFLIRSELVRRWPNMIVQGYSSLNENAAPDIAVLRAEPISKDIYIAILAGRPRRVHIREPFFGVRFGVEPKNQNTSSPPYQVDKRKPDGTNPGGSIDVPLRDNTTRVINVKGLADNIGAALNDATQKSARMVALSLEQRAYVQQFLDTKAEPGGSVPLSNFMHPQTGKLIDVKLRGGRTMNLSSLAARQAALDAMEKK